MAKMRLRSKLDTIASIITMRAIIITSTLIRFSVLKYIFKIIFSNIGYVFKLFCVDIVEAFVMTLLLFSLPFLLIWFIVIMAIITLVLPITTNHMFISLYSFTILFLISFLTTHPSLVAFPLFFFLCLS